MTNALFSHVARRSLIAVIVAAPSQVGAQFVSAIDLSSRSARSSGAPWLNQFAISPTARFDAARFSLDGRWTALRTEGRRFDGAGGVSASYFSPAYGGLQLSVDGFAERALLSETFAVSRAGADARLSYRRGTRGAWLGREVFADNKATALSAVPRVSGGAWQQLRSAVFTVSVSSFSSRESESVTRTPVVPRAPGPFIPDTGVRLENPVDTMPRPDSTRDERNRSWNDAEFAVHWGRGRLAFRGVIGTRFFAEQQPNELWAQAQGAYSLSPSLALIASTGVHPSSAAYGISRARYVELGVRVAPSALLRPRLPRGVRPTAAAFEVRDAADGRRTLRIRVPNARTVELSGDFTAWKPLALTRAGTDQWEATLAITPGIHRLAIRVDGDAWTPPPGVSSVADEFQGTVGVIVVRD